MGRTLRKRENFGAKSPARGFRAGLNSSGDLGVLNRKGNLSCTLLQTAKDNYKYLCNLEEVFFEKNNT